VPAERQAARGVAVEPVRQLRRGGVAEGERRQVAFEVVLARGAGVDRQALGLVEDDQPRVAVQDPRPDRRRVQRRR
jgi:hypothetical protein